MQKPIFKSVAKRSNDRIFREVPFSLVGKHLKKKKSIN
jgi:hypothetical protein